MNKLFDKKPFRKVARAGLRAVFTVLLFAMGYTSVLNMPPVLVALALLYYVVSRRKKWKESGKLSPAKSVLLDIATVVHVLATAALVIPIVYFALLMNRYVMGTLLATVVVCYIVYGVRKGAWIPVPLYFLAALSFPAAYITLYWPGHRVPANNRILRQRDVITPVVMGIQYTKKLGLPKTGITPNDLRRMVSDSDEKYIYATVNHFSSGVHGVLRIDLGDLKKLKLLPLPGCHNLTINKAGSVVYATSYFGGNIYVIKTPEMRLLRKIHVAKDFLQDIVLYEDRGYVLTSGELTSRTYQVNLKTGRVDKTIEPPFLMMISVLKKNEATGITYARGDFELSSFAELDEKAALRKNQFKKRKQFPWGMGFAFSPGGKTVFLNGSWFGYIYEMDLDSFRMLRKFKVRPGLRGIAVDSYRGLIYTGNYPDGYLDIVDMKSGKPLASLYFGKRMRSVLVTPKKHRVFVISMFGIFEVDVDRVLRKAGKYPRR